MKIESNIENSKKVLKNGEDRINKSKVLIDLYQFEKHPAIIAIGKAIDKNLTRKVNGRWSEQLYENVHQELVEMRDRTIDKNFPGLVGYFQKNGFYEKVD